MRTVQIKLLDSRLNQDQIIPLYATPGSAGLDLRACLEKSYVLAPQETHLINTGIAIFLEDVNLAALILPRSGLGHQHGIILGNSVGLLDSDYQGPVMVSCWNRSHVPYVIQPMERIAQLCIVPIVQAQFQIVDQFHMSQRGSDGFGSSGRD